MVNSTGVASYTPIIASCCVPQVQEVLAPKSIGSGRSMFG